MIFSSWLNPQETQFDCVSTTNIDLITRNSGHTTTVNPPNRERIEAVLLLQGLRLIASY
ncbi:MULTISPECIES: hypothetical protein [unclassified Nostoc]|uniref:hypothetical protein n=1 Tax=unclassified Nostoc TaxID=2593658 RepID=UPI00260865F8|nr:hypothetical protein [Nostoc sp. S13]MDF5734987.1 hypothetical protein [Nostoc sp. S13]